MTVVVMGYHDEATVVGAVTSVVDQVAPVAFEVVVVTSGGDGTGEAVQAAFPDIVVVESDARLLPGGARNAGVSTASGEIVAFLAADCIAEPSWVASRLAAHHAGHRVVAGAMTTADPQRPSAWALHYDLFGGRLPGRAPGPVAYPDPAAHGLSFDRDVLDQLGPFDGSVEIGEDTDAARRLAELGVHVWFEPRIRTAHRGPQHARSLLAERYRRGTAAGLVAGTTLPGISTSRALLAAPVLWTRGMVSTVGTCWRNGSRERGRLMVSLPWLAAGRAAGVVGWYRARIRAHAR